RVAFVLPRSVMAGARQHRRFREGRAAMLYAPHSALDLEHVRPLFRIPACVMVFDKVPRDARPPAPWEWPTRALAGQLPRKNASRAEADAALVESDAVVFEAGSPSQYLTGARQGVD